MSRAMPGARLEEVAGVLIDLTRRHARGVTVREVADAHTEQFGGLERKAVPTILARLATRGIARKIGGRYGRTQWCHVNYPVPFVDPDDWAPAVLEVVEILAEQFGRAVEVHEVASALRGRGLSGVTSDRVRTRLESLAHASERKSSRTCEEWSAPKLKRISITSRGGRRRVFWAPAGREVAVPFFADNRDAVRYAVGEATRDAGRAVSRREVSLWARQVLRLESADKKRLQAAHIVCKSRFRNLLAGIAVQDADSAGEPGRVRVLRTPFAGRGVYPARFFVEEPDPLHATTCLLADLAVVLKPASELAGIERLHEQAIDFGSSVLHTLVEKRRSALRHAVLRYIDRTSLEGLSAAAERAVRSEEIVAGWAEASDAKYSPCFAELHGLLDVLSDEVHAAENRITIDQTGGAPLGSVAALAREAILVNDREAEHWTPIVAGARRVRGAIAGGTSATDETDTQSFLDRPDAVLEIVRACHRPRLWAFVDAGTTALGYVLRDAQLLGDLLRRAPQADTFARHALGIALAMLGETPELEALWPDPADAEDARAYCAAVALAVDDDDDRIQLMDRADRRARGSAREVTEAALMRTEAGDRLVVVE